MVKDTPATNTESPKPRRRWITRRRIGYALLTLLILAVAFIFLLPFGIREGIEYALRKQGHQNAHVESVFFNPFTGNLVVRGLSGGEVDEAFLDAGHLRFELDWLPLFQRRVSVKTVIVEDVAAHVRRDESGVWHVGKMVFEPGPPPETPEPEAPRKRLLDLPIGLGANTVELRNIKLLFEEPTIEADTLLREARITDLRTWDDENPAPFEVDLLLNGAEIRMDGHTTPFHETGAVDSKVTVRGFPLDSLDKLASENGVEGLAGTVNADLDAHLALQIAESIIDATVTGTVDLTELAAAAEASQIQLATANWDGNITAEGPLAEPFVQAQGKVTVNDASFADESQGLSGQGKVLTWDGLAEARLAETAVLTLVGEAGVTTVAARGSEDLFGEATLEAIHATLDNTSITAGETLAFEVGALHGRADRIAVAGLTGESGRVDLASAEIDGTQLAGGIENDVITITGALVGRIRDLLAAEPNPDLLEAAVADAELQLSDLRVEVSEPGMKLDSNANVKGSAVRAKLASMPLAAELGTFSGTAAVGVSQSGEEAMQIRMQGEGGGQDILATNTESGLLVMNLANATLRGLQVANLDDVLLSGAEFQSLRVLQRDDAAAERPNDYVATLATVRTGQTTMQGTKMTVESVNVDGLKGMVTLTADGDVEPLVLLSAFMPKEEDAGEDPVPEAPRVQTSAAPSDISTGIGGGEPEPYTILVKRVEVGGDTALLIVDQSINPAANIEVRELIARVDNLDTATPDQLVPMMMEAKFGAHSQLRVAGDAAPLAGLPSAKLKVNLQTLDMPSLSGYSQRAVGYKIESGVVSVDSTVNIDKGQLDTQNDILLNKLMLAKLKKDDLTEMDNQIGMPVNTAVNLLRDANGDINLAVPVAGDLNSPEIQIGQIVRQAMAKALKGSILTVFKPLRLLGKGGKGEEGSLDEALRFKEVQFEVASATYAPESEAYLGEIAKIMSDYPGVVLRVQGFTSARDFEALAAELAPPTSADPAAQPLVASEAPSKEAEVYFRTLGKGTVEEEADEEPAAPAVPDETLLKLAQDRADAVKAYLVEQGGIDPERLIVSSATIGTEAADPEPKPPRVEISL